MMNLRKFHLPAKSPKDKSIVEDALKMMRQLNAKTIIEKNKNIALLSQLKTLISNKKQ